MTTKRYLNLRAELRKKMKRRNGLSDRMMERLEDKYHVNLTQFYGEEFDPKVVDRIVNQIAKQNPKRRRK